MSTPFSLTVPDVGGGTRRMALPVVDLPQPDSPTMPTVSRAIRSKLTSETAWTTPRGAGVLDDEVLDVEHGAVAEVSGTATRHQMPPSLTSNWARSPSPTRFSEKIVSDMKSAGKNTMWGA